MDDNDYRSSRHHSENRSVNGWKWAFILLAALILAVLIYFISAIQPVSINEANTERTERPNDEVALTTEINKRDAEWLVNNFLEEGVNDNDRRLSLSLNEDIDIEGTVQFLGLEVPFSMALTPYVLENGNLQLRATSVQLASFSLPVSAVLSLLASQMDWPEFIAIDSEAQMIVVNLNELSDRYQVDIELAYIDLENNEIRINLYVPEEVISEEIQNL